MNKDKAKQLKKARRIHRVRAKISGTPERLRLCVSRSNENLYAQIIDDTKGVTLVSVHSRETAGGTKTETALALGKLVATKAKAANITKVVFDRRGSLYHGRIKAVAEGARAGGLEF